MNNTAIPASLPRDLANLIRSATWEQESIGRSDAAVFRLIYAGAVRQYLKIVPSESELSLLPEYERLVWLKSRLPVPEVLYYGADERYSYLLMTEIPGLMSCDERLMKQFSGGRIAEWLAEGLKQIHSIEIADCPFHQNMDRVIVEAGLRVEAGLVDESDFDEERMGMTAQEVYEQLLDMRPYDEDLVLTHGDYCLPNILIDPEKREISGFIDLGRAGIADRYQDLALAERSLVYNLGASDVRVLWQSYGIKKVDDDRIAFYRLLDEFF